MSIENNTVACDGGGGALGHPRVFLRLKDEHIACPYCGKKYDTKGCEIEGTQTKPKVKRAPKKISPKTSQKNKKE
jgi:uncharacterized Zn-finger protein